MSKFKNIPTNIISGFLGAGKTTAIQYLIQQKPEAERWAVIVNEFGQIGIDGALLENDTVAIKEIPGGCLCCVGSQSLNVGLNQIIKTVKPDRILIEPTGLGHPKKLIASLTGEYYKSVLDLRAVINLLDARQLADKRYMEHETFVAQIAVADVLVANKIDTYTEEDKQRFYDYALLCKPAKYKVAMVEYGRLLIEWLESEHSPERQVESSAAHNHHSAQSVCDLASADWLMVEGHGSGYTSIGWKVGAAYLFSQDKTLNWLERILQNPAVERVKGVMQTDNGWVAINHTSHEREVVTRKAFSFSILEIIALEQLPAKTLDVELNSFTIKN